MNEFDKKLNEYADTFGENFPTFEYRSATMAEIITIIDECLKRGEPVRLEDDGRTY